MQEGRNMDPRRILVPVDRSEFAEAAVDCAVAIAELFDIPITLMHAWEPLYELGVVMGAAKIDTPEGRVPLAEHIADEAKKTLQDHVERLDDGKVKVAARLVEGPPKQAILDTLAGDEFDLVVMGTHGRTGFAHALMGSITEAIVRASPIPVMTVHATEAR
jgi:nucleotide-binding universal stress UspA family protein